MSFSFGHEELRRIRIPLGFALGVVFLWLARPTPESLLLGAGVSVLGLGMRAWAVGFLMKDQELATNGPYAFTRNPLYLGNLLIGLGLSIASGSGPALLLFLAYFLLIYPSTMKAEESHLGKLFGDRYRAYKDRVPLFLPRFLPYCRPVSAGFDWRRYWLHREYRAGIGFLVVLLILLLFVRVKAQEPPVPAAAPPVEKFVLPFELGETLIYQVKFSKLIFSGAMGRLTFSFQPSTEPPLTDHHQLRAEAVSDGIWPALFGMDVHDVIDSFVDPVDFAPDRTRKQISEGRRKVFELTVRRRAEEKAMLIRRDLARPDASPQVSELASPRWVQDVLSAIYYIRSQTLQPGQTITVPVSDSGKLVPVEAEVQAAEPIQTSWGKVDALRVVARIFGKDRLVEREGELIVWISNDSRHVPVLARLSGGFGVVTIQLKEIKGAPALTVAPEPSRGDT
ncbi:MAG: DUF3108 domain-containing protein [Acidobacteria bacterium]|nr:DUF3108 domain-containing protein [Acidobacteriota bacterium]